MSRFLTKVEKQLLTLASKAKGFNINIVRYLNMPTYEKALDLFFQNLVMDLKEINQFSTSFESTASFPKKPKREQLRNEITNFHVKTNQKFVARITEYVEFSTEYNASKKVKSKAFDKKIKEYEEKLIPELKILNSNATTYINYDKMFKLDLHKEIIDALEAWKDINYLSFVKMLGEGEISWLPKLDKDD